jgi:stage II sporulation protein AA (anti-sigma F factor antagonist)
MMSSDEATRSGTTPVVTTEVSGETGRLALFGEIDHSTAEQLDDAVVGLLDSGIRTFAVDFAQLRFFDSACIGALVRMHQLVADRDGTVKLINVNRNARRILELTGLLTQFDVVPADEPAGEDEI